MNTQNQQVFDHIQDVAKAHKLRFNQVKKVLVLACLIDEDLNNTDEVGQGLNYAQTIQLLADYGLIAPPDAQDDAQAYWC